MVILIFRNGSENGNEKIKRVDFCRNHGKTLEKLQKNMCKYIYIYIYIYTYIYVTLIEEKSVSESGKIKMS